MSHYDSPDARFSIVSRATPRFCTLSVPFGSSSLDYVVPEGLDICYEIVDDLDDHAPLRLKLTYKAALKNARRLEREAHV